MLPFSIFFHNIMNVRFWYCTLSISQSHHFMFAGTSYGDGTLLDKHGAKVRTFVFRGHAGNLGSVVIQYEKYPYSDDSFNSNQIVSIQQYPY